MTAVESLKRITDSPVVDAVGTIVVVGLSVLVLPESIVQAVILPVLWLSFLLRRRDVAEWLAVAVVALAPFFAGVHSLIVGDDLWTVGG